MAKTTKAQKKSVPGVTWNKPGKGAARTVKTGKLVKFTAKSGKTKPRLQHSLSAMFSAGLEDSRTHIADSTLPTCDAVCADLSNHLINISDSFSAQESALADEVQEITTPFKHLELDWTSANGAQSGTVSINNRMKKLQSAIDTESEALIRQWDEWVETEHELDELVNEFAMLSNEDGDVDGNVHWDVNELRLVDDDEIAQEIEKERAAIQAMIDEAAQASVKAMEEGEKKSDIQQEKAEQQFVALLREID